MPRCQILNFTEFYLQSRVARASRKHQAPPHGCMLPCRGVCRRALRRRLAQHAPLSAREAPLPERRPRRCRRCRHRRSQRYRRRAHTAQSARARAQASVRRERGGFLSRRAHRRSRGGSRRTQKQPAGSPRHEDPAGSKEAAPKESPAQLSRSCCCCGIVDRKPSGRHAAAMAREAAAGGTSGCCSACRQSLLLPLLRVCMPRWAGTLLPVAAAGDWVDEGAHLMSASVVSGRGQSERCCCGCPWRRPRGRRQTARTYFGFWERRCGHVILAGF